MDATSGAAAANANPATGDLVGRFPHRSDDQGGGATIWSGVMRAARVWWRNKTAAELAAIIGCDVRSAERYLAGDRTANAEAVLRMLGSDVGVRMVLVAVSYMTAERSEAFWKEMGKAARRAELLAERARIERELSET